MKMGKWLIGMVVSTVFALVGVWLVAAIVGMFGGTVGIMTDFLVSTVLGGVGLWYGAKWAGNILG